ncbi:threonine efflux system [Citrobacter koseri]|nr:threonine efflux system [Citrobacter koseri]
MLMLFLTVAMVHIVALMSPGPDFFFVSQTAVSRSRKEAMMGVLGITCGVMVWAGVALLGLHLIIEKMAWLHTIIMVGGWFVPVLDGLSDAAWRAEKTGRRRACAAD